MKTMLALLVVTMTGCSTLKEWTGTQTDCEAKVAAIVDRIEAKAPELCSKAADWGKRASLIETAIKAATE